MRGRTKLFKEKNKWYTYIYTIRTNLYLFFKLSFVSIQLYLSFIIFASFLFSRIYLKQPNMCTSFANFINVILHSVQQGVPSNVYL